MKYPSVTIYTGTLNPQLRLFTEMLESVKKQDYPNIKEHLVMDGGSSNGAIALAKKYQCRVDSRKHLRIQEQQRFGLGMQLAKGDLIVALESDNILPSKTWLTEMVVPFLENPDIVCSFSMHNSYNKKMSLMTKYTALLGSPDPVLYYLNKTEKMRIDLSVYDKGKIVSRKKAYDIVTFSLDNLPTMGDNGHVFKRTVINKAFSDPKTFIHVDAFQSILLQGYDTYAVVKNSIIHVQSTSVFQYMRRRIEVKKKFYDKRGKERTYYVFNYNKTEDWIKLALFSLYTITVVQPLIISIKGYMHTKEIAWFLHPFMCIVTLIGYSYSVVEYRIRIEQ